MKKTHLWLASASFLFWPLAAQAEILATSKTHFALHHEASSSMSVDALWSRLIAPENWWHPEHTYSGKSKNLSLEPEAGGLWLEVWDGGSVVHGEVVYVKAGSLLRLDAPFGPLREAGVHTIWTIELKPDADGVLLSFDIVALGPPSANMAELAKAVDYVKAEAITRLARP